MAGFNIIDKPTGTPARTDYLLKSDTSGVYTKVTIGTLLDFALFDSADFANEGFHNSIFRGKNLGTSYSAEQQGVVANGTFHDMYIGDYWVINNIRWRIAGFDYMVRTGDTELTGHNLLIFPDAPLLTSDGTTHYMNDESTTAGGYKSTKLRSTYLASCLSAAESAFGAGNIISHKEYISNTVDGNGNASNGEWVTTKIEIPSEAMIYGNNINGHATLGMHNVGNTWAQMPLAILAPDTVRNRVGYWLRDVATSSAFSVVDASGMASAAGASHVGFGVRPYFLLA